MVELRREMAGKGLDDLHRIHRKSEEYCASSDVLRKEDGKEGKSSVAESRQKREELYTGVRLG